MRRVLARVEREKLTARPRHRCAGRRLGPWKFWFASGKPQGEENYDSFFRFDGPAKPLSDKGTLTLATTFEAGKAVVGKNVGAWNGWFSNGQKSYQGSYDGTGSYVLTGKTGKKTRQAVWVGGKRNGLWLWWCDSGNPFQKVDFKADARPLGRWFDQAGDFVMAQTGVKDGGVHGPRQDNYLN
ncbi:MAG: hypothetical protein EXR79_01845 [Myxococcales bacterium]|nr:hypothetical protein [Myxococcales bacterium]